jgi:ribonuclease D
MKLITSTRDLEAACRTLKEAEFVAVDTEFIRETTFWPELCLIQMASPETEFMVDTLSDALDLAPFFELMAEPGITKVFHAARQDIEIIYHLGGLIPHPVFDTQVAAMVCGFGESVSYEQLVAQTVGKRIDKSSRFTDWRRRPLSERQLAYALADVTHLRDVYVQLRERLDREQRAHWLADEMEVLTARETYHVEPEEAWLRLKSRLRKPEELAVLRAVAAWREREARKRNVPRKRVLKDEALQEIAQQQPTDADALAQLRTIARGWERSAAAAEMLQEIRDALALPRDRMPRLARERNGAAGSTAAAELLRVLLRLTSEKYGVASKLLASASDLDDIALHGEKAEVPALSGWRREVFGEDALRLIRGEIALRYDAGKVRVIDSGGRGESV